MLPPYLLRQLYVKGSLKNLTEEGKVKGFTFSLRNRLGTGTIRGGIQISVDDQPIPSDSINVKWKGRLIPLINLTSEPFKFGVGDTIEFVINKEEGLPPGSHKISIDANTVEYGKVQFDVTDSLT